MGTPEERERERERAVIVEIARGVREFLFRDGCDSL